ncbi:ribosomal protein S12 methylthiotransferase RimO [Bacteroidia bacterium]|nr:ribosomal protein S12 methylthiotransferase RimO [Bacteroidia bacterium]
MALVKLITLGCSKNTVDSEVLAGNLIAAGHQLLSTESPKNPDVVIINTCGFIADAKQESIDNILQVDYLKRKQRVAKVYVMGCMVQRHGDELKNLFPNIDGWFGVQQTEELIKQINGGLIANTIDHLNRHQSTPEHYAYLKIAEGCDRSCSFCAIPLIRGKHVSRPIEDIEAEATQLAAHNVKELILISQDLTYYGMDLYGVKKIAELVERLSQIENIEWIRLHYLHPHHFPMDLLDVMRNNPKVCQYIDIPVQHCSNRILQSMKRHTSKEEIVQLITSFREQLPNAVLRTTIIVGYPGETDEEFEELKQFVTENQFDRLGVFKYSAEEDTDAFALNDDVSEDVKEQRMSEIMAIQQDISLQKNEAKIGQTVQVITDNIEGEYVVGRTQGDSPEVDNEVLITDDDDLLEIGQFYRLTITDANAFDLFAVANP